MLELILKGAFALLSGGATGLIGVAIQRFFDLKSKDRDLQLLKLNNDHAAVMADKQLAQSQAEWSARKDIATTQGATAIAVADKELAAREAEAASLVQVESYKADKATYLTGAVLRSKSRFAIWAMAAVDAVRGSIRPALTAYLVIMVHLMYNDMQRILASYGVEKLPVNVAQELLANITATILYLATVATVWWFGTRPPAGPGAAAKRS